MPTISEYSHLTDKELLIYAPASTPLEAEALRRFSEVLNQREALFEDVFRRTCLQCEEYCEVVEELTRATELANAAMVIFTKACDPIFEEVADSVVKESVNRVVSELAESIDPEEVEEVISKMLSTAEPSETP